MDRGRQPPINVGEPRRGHYERNHTTPTRTNRTGTTHHLHHNQSTHGDPLNEITDRWADLGREVKTLDGPCLQIDPFSPGPKMEKRTKAPRIQR